MFLPRTALFLLIAIVSQFAFADGTCPKGHEILKLEAKYTEVVRLANIYQSNGSGMEYMQQRQQAAEIVDELPYAYLKQEITFFPITKQPYCMISMFSHITGYKTTVQPRTDGKWNVYVNDVKTRDGITDSELLVMVKSAVK